MFAYDSVTAEVVECPQDIVFVVDESGSIAISDYEMMKSFLSHLVSRLAVNHGKTRVGFVSYNTHINHFFDLNAHSSVQSLQTAIDKLRAPRGDTNTHLALQYVRTILFKSAAGDRSSVPNVIVILTDGISTDMQGTQVSVNYHLHTHIQWMNMMFLLTLYGQFPLGELVRN